ncbi:hypothetical protein BDD12DRAFT_70155 [Trichophaea hybrida]|nr:hypothetical protein BDD12DRAFT_70155 [Trichophaea hybrida]
MIRTALSHSLNRGYRSSTLLDLTSGLGNVQRSALPHCQMLHPSNLKRNLPGKAPNIHLFWIDAICCPPDSAGKNEAQELAIGKMRETYENAREVLVLDSWLQSQNIENLADTEILTRIAERGCYR